MNKPLPEPAISCYSNSQLIEMVEQACEELDARGWKATWNIVAPYKSQRKRIEIQRQGLDLDPDAVFPVEDRG
jgi:hypothetical protein